MNYRTIDGKALTGYLRRKKITRVVLNIIYILCLIAVIAATLIGGVMDQHEYLISILIMILACFGIWALIASIVKACGVLRDVPNSRLFCKYGTPDAIAARIAEESAVPVLKCRQTLVTGSFIMRTDDPESYIPFESVLLLYRKEHRTNGVKDGLFLVVHDVYGDKYEYPFRLGKRHADEIGLVAEVIARSAPACRFGYTAENLNYVKEHTQPVRKNL